MILPTPTRNLESETFVPLLKLWLNQRCARFHKRYEDNGIADQTRKVNEDIRQYLQTKLQKPRRYHKTMGPRCPTEQERGASIVLSWLDQSDYKKAVLEDWIKR